MLQSEDQRRFAVEVVRRLRGAGFEAYWAGGCVRDRLLGVEPKDYDVATNALPDQVRRLFGRRRTLAIGAAFGVIAVLGPKGAGTVEVTTFRRDAPYSDGRHPDSVAFSSAEEDASRRDFTINGLFYDPLEDRVIDFVGGQRDLAERRLLAIGRAEERLAEDKLRMLRAVRFSASLDMAMDDRLRAAIVAMAPEIHVVSPERIAVEMRRILTDPNRALGLRLLHETRLAAELLPEINASDMPRFEKTLAALARLKNPCEFPTALGALLHGWTDRAGAEAVCRRWRLSNRETRQVGWLVGHVDALADAHRLRWSAVQPLLASENAALLTTLFEAVHPEGVEAAEYCRGRLAMPRAALDPPPLLTGDDLAALGIPHGPDYQSLLKRIRDAQLDGELHAKQQALEMIRGERRGERGE